jgi:sarcosine oxidase delta subunit
LERWLHSRGCRRWFNVLRNTITNEITEIYPIDTLPKSKEGKEYYDQNWRRESSVEKITNPREYK